MTTRTCSPHGRLFWSTKDTRYVVRVTVWKRPIALEVSVADPVITGWMMPLMGGAQLCRQWKAHPELGHLPGLVHPAAPPCAEEVRTWNACLQKPTPMQMFLTAVGGPCKGDRPSG